MYDKVVVRDHCLAGKWYKLIKKIIFSIAKNVAKHLSHSHTANGNENSLGS